LANGLYDHGIALRTGKTISGNKYLVVLDFDGWEAVIAWFSSWALSIVHYPSSY
jgi:hypothetical protein